MMHGDAPELAAAIPVLSRDGPARRPAPHAPYRSGNSPSVSRSPALIDAAHVWAEECLRRFGTQPVQVVHEWNNAVHGQDVEGAPTRRAFTLDELHGLFDYADDQVARVRAAGRKGLRTLFQDATIRKVAYA